jgi:hypothetical protein
MKAGVKTAGMAPCDLMGPRYSGASRNGDRRRTQSQRKNTKRPAERKQLNHTHSLVTAPLPLARARADTDAAGLLRCVMWQKEEFVRRCGNDFGVIPS